MQGEPEGSRMTDQEVGKLGRKDSADGPARNRTRVKASIERRHPVKNPVENVPAILAASPGTAGGFSGDVTPARYGARSICPSANTEIDFADSGTAAVVILPPGHRTPICVGASGVASTSVALSWDQ